VVRLGDGAGPDARVEVLDTAGRRIALLARDAAAAGWTWDGRDPHGRKAPPGDYLVRVTDGAHVRTARLVKLR
jgi:flagellar hook assembly protein FlgD